MKATGEGCGYTIGCGSTLIRLAATTEEDARKDAAGMIKIYTNSECTIQTAMLVELKGFVDCTAALKEFRDSQNETHRSHLRRELARIKRELGEA
jgi:hypothetical protein